MLTIPTLQRRTTLRCTTAVCEFDVTTPEHLDCQYINITNVINLKLELYRSFLYGLDLYIHYGYLTDKGAGVEYYSRWRIDNDVYIGAKLRPKITLDVDVRVFRLL